MLSTLIETISRRVRQLLLAVPVRWKIIGIGILPVIILGFTLNYWVITGLSDWLSYILTDVRVEAAMSAGSRSVIFVTVIAALFSVLILWVLVYILNSPLEDLKKTAQEVASGKFDTRADVWANDEIGELAKSINTMIDNFVDIQDDISRTNRQLSARNAIAMAAEQENEIHDVLYIMLENLLELTGLEFGWVYLYDPELRKHHLASWKGVPKDLEGILLVGNLDPMCTCQQNLVEGQQESNIEFLHCEKLHKCEHIIPSDRHITVPIMARNIHFGVINLHYPSPEPVDDETYELLSSIGTQISEIVANAWLQIKLREKEASRQLLLESLVTAQEDERNLLARELHDQAGQTLTNLLIRLKTIENKSVEENIKDELNTAQEIVSQTIDQMRDLSYRLRPPALDEFGIGAAVTALADDIQQQTEIKVICNCVVDEKIPQEVEMFLYRIAQEGLTNIVRHAEATRARIYLERLPSGLYMKIEDNGKGFDPNQISPEKGKRHLGLISMNERAELIGGTLELFSAVGKGTTIEVQVPISQIEVIEANEQNPHLVS